MSLPVPAFQTTQEEMAAMQRFQKQECLPFNDLSGDNRLHYIERRYSPDLWLFFNLIIFGRNQEGNLI